MANLFGTLFNNIKNHNSSGYDAYKVNEYIPLHTNSNNYLNEQGFINNSISSSTIKGELLKKLRDNGTIKPIANEIKDTISFNRSPLNIKPNGYVVKIDDTDNGNLTTAFLNVLNKYTTEDQTVNNTVQFYNEKTPDKLATLKQVYSYTTSKPSIFNPYFAVKSNGFSTNKPLLDIENASTQNPFVDTSDCSIWALLKASADGNAGAGVGMGIYRLADFMYCKDLGKVSNNHLITLRRYATPVGDNIFKPANSGDPENMFSVAPDVGHLVTWFGTDDNKLSDIMKMSFNATWKEMEAEIQQIDGKGAGDGILGMIGNTLNPVYNKLQGAGVTAGHDFITRIGTGFSFSGVNFGVPGPYENHPALTNYDKNKIYEPKDTIQSNHYYEGKLVFNQEFTLNFSYKMRAYGSLNQKAVMLDLINNILRVTYTKGKFWGGEVKWVGPPGNNGFMKKAHSFIDNSFDKLWGFGTQFLEGAISWQEIFANLSNAASGLLDSAKDAAQDVLNGKYKEKMTEYGKELSEHLKNGNYAAALKGQLKNALGRPALYAVNSFVSGEDLGLWHVTIGNPLNPIASFGNLIVTNTELSFGDVPLGIDDFPTEIKVAVTLKHCKPRDMVGIGHMFTKGETGLALPIGQTGWSQFHKGIDPAREGIHTYAGNYVKRITNIHELHKEGYGEFTIQQLFGTGGSDGNKQNISLNAAEIS